MKGSQEFKIILVKLFNDILEYQESALSTTEFKDLTNNDIHVISAIGMNTKKSMSMIAKELTVTFGTLTISMNSLVRKGYVVKERSEKDKRVVLVNLSQKGERAFLKYEEFNDEMVKSMLENMGDVEMDTLMSALVKINRWIKKRLP
ncbi:MarR family winged helix-turn-helix transcriptional regulator [Lachnoanaerobaculum umeaense]|uniref:HTH-type transcriptional regulator SarZ n=1 Tax=Lachnoanaerobaculum umeaense TaxID=617123 RepID=A0A385Q0N5_9FIRM|nr:MarR family winged helix-turn-helix transcriptional regulator [Lachnoanaerobaculum umeaense]AYA99822.1 MarR family transcriptional regulator [Lachnoanaerobaculum umeaense]PZW96805.1 DNA-binding MarR family transcriptional regulator [Lachnoanaerobaculum umeaense]